MTSVEPDNWQYCSILDGSKFDRTPTNVDRQARTYADFVTSKANVNQNSLKRLVCYTLAFLPSYTRSKFQLKAVNVDLWFPELSFKSATKPSNKHCGKKELSSKLGSYDVDQLSLSTTDGGTHLQPDRTALEQDCFATVDETDSTLDPSCLLSDLVDLGSRSKRPLIIKPRPDELNLHLPEDVAKDSLDCFLDQTDAILRLVLSRLNGLGLDDRNTLIIKSTNGVI